MYFCVIFVYTIIAKSKFS